LKSTIFVLSVFCSCLLFGQKKAPVEYILEVDNDHRNSGWYIGAGTTFMLPSPSGFDRTDSLMSGVTYNSNYNAKGKFGLNVELGRYNIFERGFIHFLDYGVYYRKFKGEEIQSSALNAPVDPLLPANVSGLGIFKQNFLGVNIGANRLMGINRYFFLLHNVSLQAQYRMVNEATFETNSLLSPILVPESSLEGELIYKLGAGFRMRKGLLVLSGSIPLFSSYYTEDVLSKKKLFHSKYHPLVFSLRYMWLNKQPDRVCPPSKGRKGSKRREKLFPKKMY